MPREYVPPPSSDSVHWNARTHAIRRFLLFIILLLVATGVWYVYTTDKPQQPAKPVNDRYAVVDKRVEGGSHFPHPTRKTPLGYPDTVWMPDRYFLTFLAESDQSRHEIEVTREVFNQANLRAIITEEQFQRIPRRAPQDVLDATTVADKPAQETLQGGSMDNPSAAAILEKLEAIRDQMEERKKVLEEE